MFDKPFQNSPEANAAWWQLFAEGNLATGKYPIQAGGLDAPLSLWRRCKHCDRVQHLDQHGRECNRCGETLED